MIDPGIYMDTIYRCEFGLTGIQRRSTAQRPDGEGNMYSFQWGESPRALRMLKYAGTTAAALSALSFIFG